uniref:hypothetical protein n=1 Tax=Paractinoplanes polyasparticus TaxID=2856853 RepID=UPI001C860ECF|nr:hypothetical protein [Actinoplanes polyasparticus]
MRRIFLSIALVLSGLAFATPASAAAAAPTVRLVSATVVAGGAGVDFRYTVNCGGPGRFALNQYVSQEVGEESTSATGTLYLDCTGRPQDVSLRAWYSFRLAAQPGPATHELTAAFLLAGGNNTQQKQEGAVTLGDGAPRNVISAPGVPTMFFYGASVDPAADKMTLNAVWKCDSSPATSTGITVAQAVDGRVAYGHGGFEYECTGQWETTEVVFTGTVSQPSFRAGTVSVTSQFGWCGNDENGEFSCTDRSLSDTVTVG